MSFQARFTIFVYGSLKRGFHNHDCLRGQTFVGEARTEPVYRLLSLHSYPGMIEAPTNGRSVHGELWSVDARCKALLDRLEGVEVGFYRLAEVRLLPPHDSRGVWTYLYARSTAGLRDAGEVWTQPRA